MIIGKDIYGQELEKIQVENVKCLRCEEEVASSRYAPHLEKCMGFGSRLSNRMKRNRDLDKRLYKSAFDSSSEEDNDKSVGYTPYGGGGSSMLFLYFKSFLFI